MDVWHLQTDFLIVVLRDVIQAYPDVRVVLMSATVDATMFREYFFNCPIIEVFGRTFPVEGSAAASSAAPERWRLLSSRQLLLPQNTSWKIASR